MPKENIDNTERRFEEDIESFLISEKGGYRKGDYHKFDKVNCLNREELFEFIKTTQPQMWEKYVKIYKEDAEDKFIKRFNEQVNRNGILFTLRNKIEDRGCKFKLMYTKPETKLNDGTQELYKKNIFTETRQLHYSTENNNSIDMVLSINGIPIVAIELKNQYTGQSVIDSKLQFIDDRDPKELIFQFNKRILACFAVDHYEAWMTTKLNKEKTRFMPFNLGSNGAGNVGGAGNPPCEDGYTTSYLWENVLQKDSLLDILHRFLHLQVKEEEETVRGKKVKVTKETLIFPRYHQLDAVRKLTNDVLKNGSGTNYLIQHSAGSGKSNSIAWLAHRLQSLHKDDKAIFNSVIVLTDRNVLDKQLQDTIYQFDHVDGVVEKISKEDNKHSKELKEAINDGKRIIISTIQKFPYIYRDLNDMSGKRFAIIVDEAHSSQSGKAASSVRAGLADIKLTKEEYDGLSEDEREILDNNLYENEAENLEEDYQDEIEREISSQGQQSNLSFFAFTATPKNKTLQMFGTKGKDGKYRPFHVYSMKQAIEEGYILDVLQNYTTYKTYYEIAKNTENNPNVPKSKTTKLILRFAQIHPYNISQKTAIMIEHFRNETMKKIGGKAKAMVVTASRLQAVRYFKEFKRYIKEKGYEDVDVLIAFSGEIKDSKETVSEPSLNKTRQGKRIAESQTKNYFHSPEFNLLIVAEKYQTGFDEPLLHTMYVDKKLSDIKAVQTLSRLNRTCSLKDDTFILDFENSVDDIQSAFEPYYESTILSKESDPNHLYDLIQDIEAYRLWSEEDVEKVSKIHFKRQIQTDRDFGKITSIIKVASDKYSKLTDEKKIEYRSSIKNFLRLYDYITQIVKLDDADLHKKYQYLKYLIKFLPVDKTDPVDIEGKLKLERYKIVETFKGQIKLNGGKGEIEPAGNSNPKKLPDQKEPLDEIIDLINERYKGQLTDGDKVIIKNFYDRTKNNKDLEKYAKANDKEMFVSNLFKKVFQKEIIKAYKENGQFYEKLFRDDDFSDMIMKTLAPAIYDYFHEDK